MSFTSEKEANDHTDVHLETRKEKPTSAAHLTVDETAQAQAGCLEATYADWTDDYPAD